LLLGVFPVGHGALDGAEAGRGKADTTFALVGHTPGDYSQAVALEKSEVAGQGGPVHAEEVCEGLVGDGLGLVNRSEEKELGDAKSAGAEGGVVELGEESGGAAGVEAEAVADVERGWHPG
jgi:hypothetical protein